MGLSELFEREREHRSSAGASLDEAEHVVADRADDRNRHALCECSQSVGRTADDEATGALAE